MKLISGNLMLKEKTILFVAFEFPPLGGAGVQRSLKFVKYLPHFNIRPIVITVREDDYKFVMAEHPMDESLKEEIPVSTIIKRIHCGYPKPSKNRLIQWVRIYFSVSENYKTYWRSELERRLPAIIDKYAPTAIYISLPPFAMATLWRKILRKYNIPLIVDFRDAWSQWCLAPVATYLHYLLKVKAERDILNKATKVICSSGQIMADMKNLHPMIDQSKFSVINNGYDSLLDFKQPLSIGSKSKVIIGYVGAFYYTPESRENIFKPWWKKPLHRMLNYVPRKEDWLYRSPWYFFKALRLLLDKEPGISNILEIRFAGITPDWLLEQIRGFKLEAQCRHYGYLNHDAVIEFQKECDALLITSSKVVGGRDYSIAGKTYEYFSIGKPIIAFVCSGAQKDILEESKMAVICDPDKPDESAKMLKEFIDKKIILSPDKNELEKYHRKNLTKKLALLVNSITTS